MLEALHFTILTDHRLLTLSFQQKRDKCSPRQFNYMDNIIMLTTDILLISGHDNIVADQLSRVEASASWVTMTRLPQPGTTMMNSESYWRATQPYT